MLKLSEYPILYLLIIAAGIAIIVYGTKYLKTLKSALPMLSEFLDNVAKYSYIVSLIVPVIYLPYYYFLYGPSETNPPLISVEIHEYIKTISIVIFTAGIYSAATKWVTNSETFKSNFKKTILSQEFDDLLTKKMDSFSLSDNYLLSRSDLNDIWSRITVFKYIQKFPEIEDALKSKMNNELYHENNLTYYYKNFRTQLNYELLDDNIVKITEISNFTVVANDIEPREMNFWISTNDVERSEEGSEEGESFETDKILYTRYVPDRCTIDGMKLDIKSLNENKNEKYKYVKLFTAELKGKKRYEIERSVEMTQNLETDRVFSFSSARIIDNLSVKINHCEKLNIFFSPVGDNIFKLDNQITEGQSYLSREILLSGEKFKTFIYKKS